MICEEVEELAGAYALGALPPDDLRGVEEHVLTCSKHPEIAELSAVASSLALASPEAEPPPALRARIMDVVREEGRPAPAIALLVVVLTNDGGSSEPGASVITLTGEGEARAVVHVLEDGIIAVEAAGLQSLSDDQTYQVWAITDDGPSSLGLLGTAPDGEALGAMRSDLGGVESLAVTIEPAGGSAQPTSAPVLEAEV